MAGRRQDETFCFYDRQYLDDELNRQLAQFASGVRILLITDCCHAASNFKDVEQEETDAPPVRSMGIDRSMEIIQRNRAVYDEAFMQSRDFLRARDGLAASLTQLAACQDSQLSGDSHKDEPHPLGVFTSRLVNVWNNGAFNGSYEELVEQVGSRIPKNWNQTPQYLTEGPENLEFAQQKPFSI
ncbi:MAG: caspase family protein [Thiolinea sp.]